MKPITPCPFCKEAKDLEKWHWVEGFLTDNDDYSVRCANCGALGPPAGTWPGAVKEWDERK